MIDDEVIYYQRRAETEVKRAQRAKSPEVVAAHHEMATAYLDRVAALQGRAALARG